MSRRSLLRRTATAGAAGLAVTALGAGASPALAAARGSARTERQGATRAAAGPIVVHLRDARSGDIEVFSGTSQIRLHDRDLAARIARAVR